MSDRFEGDEVIERVSRALRASPAATPDPRAVARVLAAVWESPRPSAWRRVLDRWRMPTFTRLGVVAMAGGALALGFLVRGLMVPATEASLAATPVAPAGAAPGAPVVLASNDGERLIPTQFILDDATARRVSVVGDFNEWKPGETPLVRLANGVWTATVPLPAGRHVYAFVLDDTLFVPDPRAPKAGDADYGREGSVVMVFAP
jgi:hypothetical protein